MLPMMTLEIMLMRMIGMVLVKTLIKRIWLWTK